MAAFASVLSVLKMNIRVKQDVLKARSTPQQSDIKNCLATVTVIVSKLEIVATIFTPGDSLTL